MVQPDVVRTRVGRAAAWLNDAETLFAREPEAFVADRQGRDLALFYLFLSIQECIDLAAHWVADAGWGAPDDAGSTFDALADRGALDRPTADTLRAATGLRNRIAHGYALLDYARVQQEARVGLPALRTFLAAISREARL